MRSIRVALHRRIGGRVLSAIGVLLTGAGLLTIPVLLLPAPAFFDLADSRSLGHLPIMRWWLGAVIVGLTGLVTGSHIRMVGHRLRQPAGAKVLAAGVDFVLLLRSFGLDSVRHREQSLMTGIARSFEAWSSLADFVAGPPVEAPLVTALCASHPVIAVGRPGEWLPALGASRLYLQADTWQHEIVRLMGRAKLIVVVAGRTEGVLWELQTALRTGALERVVIYVPIDFKEPDHGNEQWRQFRTVLLETLLTDEIELPSEFPTDVMIGWTLEEGRPKVLIARPSYDAAITDLHGSLRATGEEYAFKQRPLELSGMISSLLEQRQIENVADTRKS